MFIKVIYNNEEWVYQCYNYSIYRAHEDKSILTLNIEGPNNVYLKFTEPFPEIFVMNNDGKTIERYT